MRNTIILKGNTRLCITDFETAKKLREKIPSKKIKLKKTMEVL